jgi:hypothetical protein
MKTRILTLALALLTTLATAQERPIKNLRLEGTFNGTPTGGTLDLGNVTLSAQTYGFSGDADTFINLSDPNEVSLSLIHI